MSCSRPGQSGPLHLKVNQVRSFQLLLEKYPPSSKLSPGMTLMSMSWGTEEKEISSPQMDEVEEAPVCTSASQAPCNQI